MTLVLSDNRGEITGTVKKYNTSTVPAGIIIFTGASEKEISMLDVESVKMTREVTDPDEFKAGAGGCGDEVRHPPNKAEEMWKAGLAKWAYGDPPTTFDVNSEAMAELLIFKVAADLVDEVYAPNDDAETQIAFELSLAIYRRLSERAEAAARDGLNIKKPTVVE